MRNTKITELSLKQLGISALAASLLVIAGCSDQQQDAVEEVEESTAEVMESGSGETEAAGAAEAMTGDSGSSAGTEEEGAWDKTKEASKDAWDKTKDVSKDVWEDTKEEAAKEPTAEDPTRIQLEDR